MESLLLSRDAAGRRAETLYRAGIQSVVDTLENLGKLVVIDIDSGRYLVDQEGFEAAHALRAGRPKARLVALRIGYDVAAALGGGLHRVG